MMKIGFLSGIIPDEYEETIRLNSKFSVEYAANEFQKKILKGLIDNEIHNITLFNSIFVNSYPRGYKKKTIDSFEFKMFSHSFFNIGFTNIYGIRMYSKIHTIKPHLKKWLIDCHSNDVLIGYSIFNPNIELFLYAKKLNSKIKTVLVLPDLPIMCKNNSKIHNFKMKFIQRQLEIHKKSIDLFVVLTEQMAKYLNLKKNEYLVIEGMINSIEENNKNIKSDEKKEKVILYTGTLDKKYGIDDLLNSFTKIKDDNVRLHIYGKGNYEKKVISMAKEDNRIKYFGLETPQRIRELQRDAFLLVNPRKNDLEYTKYSFPSKTLEYMESGTPLVAYKLDGIPSEYTDYYHCVHEGNDALQHKIEELLLLDDHYMSEFGEKAKKYVVSNKSPKFQISKLIEELKNDR